MATVPAPVTVTRSLDLAAPVHEVWSSLADAAGLSGWLADAVELVVVPGAVGVGTTGDSTRTIVVTHVEPERRIGFVWWDDARPECASTVTIELAPSAHGEGSTVTVTERLVGAPASASLLGVATVDDLAGIESAWDDRLHALLGGASLRSLASV